MCDMFVFCVCVFVICVCDMFVLCVVLLSGVLCCGVCDMSVMCV